jgi:hypothetical protein
MKETLGLVPGSSVLYISPGEHSSAGMDEGRYVEEYAHWHLVLQPDGHRAKRGAAAGLIIAKREVVLVTDLLPEEWADVATVLQDGPRKLCERTGTTFTGHFTGPAFNNGSFAGQTQAQVHGHLYPVIHEDLPAPGVRNGMGAMIEAHRVLNLGQ